MLFKDRHDAGKKLANKLKKYKGQQDLIVLALPRGGVPVAFEVAEYLEASLDIFIVRKLGVPGQEELAMGAIASGGTLVLNKEIIQQLHIDTSLFEHTVQLEKKELDRRESLYRQGRPALTAAGKTVIIIDDGLATGASMRAAILALRDKNPKKLIAAAPVGAEETCRLLSTHVDELICLLTPISFGSVGSWYENFSQTSDTEVMNLLEKAASNVRFQSQKNTCKTAEK